MDSDESSVDNDSVAVGLAPDVSMAAAAGAAITANSGALGTSTDSAGLETGSVCAGAVEGGGAVAGAVVDASAELSLEEPDQNSFAVTGGD